MVSSIFQRTFLLFWRKNRRIVLNEKEKLFAQKKWKMQH